MIKDHVKCCNCEREQYVDIGEEVCPLCNIEGCLAWVDHDNPEVEVD